MGKVHKPRSTTLFALIVVGFVFVGIILIRNEQFHNTWVAAAYIVAILSFRVAWDIVDRRQLPSVIANLRKRQKVLSDLKRNHKAK